MARRERLWFGGLQSKSVCLRISINSIMLNPDRRIFHITAENNLPGIFASKGLIAKNSLQSSNIVFTSIAYQTCQSLRASVRINVDPGGVLHDYVPFYFAPRSPMLRAINSGYVDNCPYRQHQIIHMETNINHVVNTSIRFVFFDKNATIFNAKAYNDLRFINQIRWDLLLDTPQLDGYCKYWADLPDKPGYESRKAARSAEFLIHRAVPISLICRIGVADESALIRVKALCEAASVRIPIEVKPAWYY